MYRAPGARTIRVARSAATGVGSYLDGQEAELDEPLLLGLKADGIPSLLHRVFEDRMREAGRGSLRG
ncbi:hypothetical protein [Streptomyces acidiscabies]|uniref:Uncharacterized protein n=1 Tax=Streptomyces acidiscabies TaxID=42234 RepID=A0ABU4MC09_9ACTN|nr:hypothetical protein [Streptomyces acidiscabies]MDX3025625.1 hypothetical protein [Streptomyces acidiscabies]